MPPGMAISNRRQGAEKPGPKFMQDASYLLHRAQVHPGGRARNRAGDGTPVT